jgi:4-hydroxybenzoate polyprenyltransferase
MSLSKGECSVLLCWPCAWGLTLAYAFSKNLNDYFFYLFLFFLGSLLMRSAGCIVHDISDKEFDKKVSRTKNRPIASNQVSIKLGIFYTLILCLLALLVLINFNNLTILLALGSMPLAFTYPLMKRFTYWPQLFLGITFNYGLILGWTAIQGEINAVAIIFYFGAIFWTLGYDTIYGFQDIKDDEIIGVKSTSIKFKKNPTQFLLICLLIFSTTLLMTGYIMNFNYLYFLSLLFVFFHLFFYQLKKFDSKDALHCLKLFKTNNHLGFFTYLSLLIGKISL